MYNVSHKPGGSDLGQGSRPHPYGSVIEQGAHHPLWLVGDLVAHHLEDVVHGSLPSVVHFVDAGAAGQQQVHHLWVDVLTGHVEWRLLVLVQGVDVGPGLQQQAAHLEVALQVLQLLGVRAGRVQRRLALVVVLLQRRAVAQVQLRVSQQAVPGRHV